MYALITTDFGFTDIAQSIKLQTDNKILLAGYSGSNFALARYGNEGFLDTTFGINGKVITNYNNLTSLGYDVALQSNKIILAGKTSNETNSDSILVRYNSNGEIDTTFGTNGFVSINVGNIEEFNKVLVQTDNKIIVSGFTNGLQSTSTSYNFLLMRFNENGDIDTTFGSNNNGIVITDISNNNDYSTSLALQPDGKIVLAGIVNVPTTNIAVIRYNTSGNLDSSFGNNGIFMRQYLGLGDYYTSLAIQPDNKILLGSEANLGATREFFLLRINSNGVIDTTFGNNGQVVTDFSGRDKGNSIAIQTDGKILYGGFGTISGNINFAVARYNSNGTLDTSFGTGGKVNTNFFGISQDYGYSLALQPDGKFILAGSSNSNFAMVRYNLDGSIDTSFGAPYIPICFLSGTPVETDQGIIEIQKIKPNFNTIKGKKIIAITKTITMENKIVCIEKDAIKPNIPSQITFISKNHKLLINNQMIKAKYLVGKIEGVYLKDYNGEILYNVLLNTYNTMVVNNLIVETLDPNNIIAQCYNGKLNENDVLNIFTIINKLANKYKKSCNSLN